MQKELDALDTNHTLELTTLPPGAHFMLGIQIRDSLLAQSTH